MTGENLTSIYFASMELVYWSVRLSSMRGGDGVKKVDEMNRYQPAVCFFMKIWCEIQVIKGAASLMKNATNTKLVSRNI